jgi:2-amino-4-hydroxy-6-hydroxymethyldihydropteridine diphosphokinase
MQKLAYLSLGSNLGDRAANLAQAIDLLGGIGEVVAVSDLYETEPFGVSGQPWFLNCAVALRTEKMPRQLMRALLKLERSMGRRRTNGKKEPRIIDMDLLLMGDAILSTPDLILPHPGMAQRRFVLLPLAQIAPEAVHPVLKRSVRELADRLPASSGEVRRLPAGFRKGLKQA